MKGDENRIPYIDNIIILINFIEYDVILGVLVDHAMIRNVLKYLAYCIYIILQKISRHRTMLVGHKCMCYKGNNISLNPQHNGYHF